MTAQRNNVLLPMALPTQKCLRAAVARIIRTIQLEASQTDEETADALGVSVGTIRNARNETSDLNAATIARIGAKYGWGKLDPYSALYGARNVPLEAAEIDALPSLAGAIHRLAVVQSPTSAGGAAILHDELLDILPELKAAQDALSALIARAERLAA